MHQQCNCVLDIRKAEALLAKFRVNEFGIVESLPDKAQPEVESGVVKQSIKLHPRTSCCGYQCSVTLPYIVHWNEYNKSVMCHSCGAAYSPATTLRSKAHAVIGKL